LKGLNSRFHESTAVFTKDGKAVYFTRNNYNKKRKKDTSGITRLKIFSAQLGKITDGIIYRLFLLIMIIIQLHTRR
tara:strand:- start:18 stop:245 length:228 start_codon:yes stop_codon:yes gene_type:complete